MNGARSYELILVTPAFVGGAEPANPELRAPSVRGLLRWWFRLECLGQNLPMPEIRRRESDIFGSAEPTIGQRLTMRVRPQQPVNYEPLDYQGLGLDGQYLWFPLRPSRGSSKPINREALAAGTRFAVELRLYPPRGEGQERMEALERALMRWALLGGIGHRSRRCAGSLWFADRLPSDQPLPRGQEEIEALLRRYAAGLPIQLRLSPQSFPTWQQAMSDIGHRYREARRQLRNKAGRFALPLLGWPIMNFPGPMEVNDRPVKRLASPLLLKVVPDGNRYRWLAVLVQLPFYGQLRYDNKLLPLSYLNAVLSSL
jgi:CRISPR-associated protein Cmr1